MRRIRNVSKRYNGDYIRSKEYPAEGFFHSIEPY